LVVEFREMELLPVELWLQEVLLPDELWEMKLLLLELWLMQLLLEG
jgi:hypothetical protein